MLLGAEAFEAEPGVDGVGETLSALRKRQLDSATMPIAGRSRMSVPVASIRKPFTAVSKNE